MSQSSVGFKGTVNEVQWARLTQFTGHGPCITSTSSGKVTQVAGVRAVSVSAGGIYGDGVLTDLSVPEQMDLPPITNGQWFLLVLNRVWATKATQLVWRNGPTTATAQPGIIPASYPASTATAAGSNADVPVAWAWGNSTSTTVTIVPILLPPSPAALTRGTAAERDAHYGTPSNFYQAARLQGRLWHNTDNGRLERFYPGLDSNGSPKGFPWNLAGAPANGRSVYGQWMDASVGIDTGWVDLVPGTNWNANTGNLKPQVRRRGTYIEKRGGLFTNGSLGTTATTVPAWAVPPMEVNAGAAILFEDGSTRAYLERVFNSGAVQPTYTPVPPALVTSWSTETYLG